MTQRRRRRVGLVALLLLLGMGPTVAARADDPLCSTPPFSTNPTGSPVTITVDWLKLNACLTKEPRTSLGNRITRRINEDDVVRIHVVNFNFVNYTIAYKIDETVVESYVMLEKLFSQLLGLPFPGAREADATRTAYI